MEETEHYDSLFIHAVSCEDMQGLKKLVTQYTPSPHVQPNPLHIAAARQNIELLEFLVQLDIFDINVKQTGTTILHRLIQNGQGDYVMRLIQSYKDKINVNVQDDFGYTPLHIAALAKDTATYDFLIEQGADAKITDKLGRTAGYYTQSQPQVVGKFEFSLDQPLRSHPEEKVKMVYVSGKKVKKPKPVKKDPF